MCICNDQETFRNDHFSKQILLLRKYIVWQTTMQLKKSKHTCIWCVLDNLDCKKSLNSQFACRVFEFVSTCISCSDKSGISDMKY